MSQFITKIAVDIDAVKGMLPNFSDVESIAWNHATHDIELVWSNDKINTGYSFPLEYSIAQLQASELPKGATVKTIPVHPSQPVQQQSAPSTTKPGSRKKKA